MWHCFLKISAAILKNLSRFPEKQHFPLTSIHEPLLYCPLWGTSWTLRSLLSRRTSSIPFTSTTRFFLLEAIIHPPVTFWKWKLYSPIAIKIKTIPSPSPPVSSAIWFCLSLQTHSLFLLLHPPLVADFRTHYPNHGSLSLSILSWGKSFHQANSSYFKTKLLSLTFLRTLSRLRQICKPPSFVPPWSLRVPLIDATTEDKKDFFVRPSLYSLVRLHIYLAKNYKHLENELPCCFSVNIDYPNH